MKVPTSCVRPYSLSARQPRETPTAELAERWRADGDQSAREELFLRYLPLARRLAHRYRNPYETVDDLEQVASVGLLAAIDRFDPERGDFAAFAIPTILGTLKRHFRNTAWAVHVPRGAQELALRVDQAVRRLTHDLGRSPRVEQIARYFEVSSEDVLLALEARVGQYSLSLDCPAGDREDGSSTTLIDVIGGAERQYDMVETQLTLAAVMRALPYSQRRAVELRLRYDMKQSDIARELGCSQMQVSRLLREAAARLAAC